ncbi:MAG: serine hydrolase [Candidatus Aminicenantes bacterium]|nr:MAG: serine hydrolase [Candidatus Aminicenantes bacterium]
MLFGIGSVTKTFTAALILKIAEEGAIEFLNFS